MDVRNLGDRLDSTSSLDPLTRALGEVVHRILPKGDVKDALHGVFLGHPLHPLMTDLPIGFWTSAWCLDMIPSRRLHPAADLLIALGVASAVPTAAAGIADWSELNRPEQRSGVVHAAANITATALYTASLVARRRGRRGTGVALAMAGAAAATAGGYLGGHLSFRRGAGVNRTADTPKPAEWTGVDGDAPSDRALGTADLDGSTLVTANVDGRPVALADRCSHLGGPLHEGTRAGDCVRCPWHGSEFALRDGSVARGPATAPQPAYEVRTAGAGMEVRARPGA